MNTRPPGWYPRGARLVQLREGRKRPVGMTSGRLAGVIADNFVPLGTNIGIILDEMWIAVDVDRPESAAETLARLPAKTWQQKTPRGSHRLYSVPFGWTGKNTKFAGGEFLVNAYIVAPGSYIDPTLAENTGHPGGYYELVDASEPVPAPQWLLDLCAAPQSPRDPIAGVLEADARDMIPDGERDNALAQIAGLFRRLQLSQPAMARALGAVNRTVIEQPPGREVTEQDIARIARSIAHKPVGERAISFLPSHWSTGSDMELVREPVKWWVRDFVPQGDLTMLYGKGGIGKSSWGSWLAALVTQRGGKFGYIGVEEQAYRFIARAVLCGADRDLIAAPDNPLAIQLPNTADILGEQIEQYGLNMVYFDSLYSHFAPTQGLNAAERARRCMGPLAEVAQRTGCTIVGVFHERKDSDTYLGSVEMVNVARYVLRATRTDGPLKVSVEKTNGRTPDYCLAYTAELQPWTDPLTGEVQMEEDESGKLVPYEIAVPRRIANESLNVLDTSEIVMPKTEEPKRVTRRVASIKELL